MSEMDAAELRSFIFQSILLTLWLGCFGTQIELDPLIEKFKVPKGIILGACLQSIFLPAWTSMLIYMFSIKGYIATGFLLISCSPGGTFSNAWCLITQSDLPLSAAMTGFSTFISSGMMPLNLIIWNRFIEDTTSRVPMVQVLTPALSVIIGTGSGMFLRRRYNLSEKTIRRMGLFAGIIGFIAIPFSLIGIYIEDKPTVNFRAPEYFMAILMNGTTLVIGCSLARLLGLKKPECVSVGFEVSTQNVAIPLFIFYNAFEETSNLVSVLFLFGATSIILNLSYAVTMTKMGWTNRGKSDETINDDESQDGVVESPEAQELNTY